MRVLVACEFSGRVRDAFAAIGHDAWSCDLLPTESPGNHIQRDCLQVLEAGWDLVIAHPPCTYLTSSAEWALKDPDFERYPGVGYHQKLAPGTLFGQARREARREAIELFKKILNAPVSKIAIENPVGCISKKVKESTQRIQPYEHGEDAKKTTCLWLKGLPNLRPTKYIPPRMVDGKPRWANQTDSGQNRVTPSKDRWAERSLTPIGIALAMAMQWGVDSKRTESQASLF